MRVTSAWFVPAAFAATVLLAACGGGGGITSYSRPGFQSCLNQNGVVTHTLGEASHSVRTFFAEIGSENFIAAVFPDGEEDGFLFAQNQAGVSRIVSAIDLLEKEGRSSPGVLVTKGNMVLLMQLHPTAGAQKIIDTCEANARLT